ncbi:MAG: HlyC/CorC family transporter [Alphaproteobacteria bacterium]|nr:HlyC/CorC family transporter [Alphaproteobacteria bacterium]
MGDTHQGLSSGSSTSDDNTGPDTGEHSGAARRAQAEQKQGFFSRLFGTSPPLSNGVVALNGTKRTSNGHSLAAAGGLANLNRVRVQDVAVPRAEIVSVPVEIELEALVSVFRDSGLTRLPVFDETLDRPLGFVHLKDLALKHGFACDDSDLAIKDMLRPLLFAPPSMPIGVLFQKMQTDRLHMALVIDEYGGVDGLVTIEDLIEEVVGEIEDEHDLEEDQFWSQEKPGVYLCQARTPLDEFEAEIGFSLMEHIDEDEVETLGGLVFVLTGRVPVRGEVIKHQSGVEFEILDADPRRIKRLRVVLPRGKSK